MTYLIVSICGADRITPIYATQEPCWDDITELLSDAWREGHALDIRYAAQVPEELA